MDRGLVREIRDLVAAGGPGRYDGGGGLFRSHLRQKLSFRDLARYFVVVL